MTVIADKKLGQHFLRDGRVIGRIAEAIGQVTEKQDIIIEVGPGTGALTRPLLDLPNNIILLEKDTRCVEALTAMMLECRFDVAPVSLGCRFVSQNRQILLQNVDVLSLNWRELLKNGETGVVVGNLPYNVGTEIVADLLHAAREGMAVRRMLFMLQKEVVQRICAKPGSKAWGRLGVLAHLLADCRSLFDIAPGAFNPPPKVMSSIVDITPLPAPRYPVDMGKLDRLLRLAFGQKRKMLRASLRGHIEEQVFAELKIDPTARPETLTTEQLCRLAGAL